MSDHRLDVHLTSEDLRSDLFVDVQRGLTSDPKTLPPKYFYDERGSRLFEEITRLPEYYLTRAERSILESRAHDIARLAGADTLVELGSGSSEKTRLLIDGFADGLRRYVPVDVSPTALEGAMDRLAASYPSLELIGVVADFHTHLSLLPSGSRRMLAFLGSTIGNLDPDERQRFLSQVRGVLAPGDTFLLGTDLVKDPQRLIGAYDDAAGVTAAFNRNVLRVLNRTLKADFDPGGFDHVAVWDPDNEWVEMRLRAHEDVKVRIEALELAVDFRAGEDIRTEISAKFRRDRLQAELEAAGLRMSGWWTDEAGDFALSLSTPAAQPG